MDFNRETVWTSIAKQHGLDVAEKWYEHKPEPVIETATIKFLWDFTIQTDREIQARRPEIVLVNRKDSLRAGSLAGLGKEKTSLPKLYPQTRKES